MRKFCLILAASAAFVAVSCCSYSANAVTFHFSFNNAPNFDLVEGTISGLVDNATSPATSVQVTSNPAGFGIGEYIGSPVANSFGVLGGMVIFANFQSFGLQNALGGNSGVTCCSLALSVLTGPGLSNDPMSIGSGSLNLVFTPVSQVPLPAALPLFATGLGALGLLGWRRKRKTV